MARSLPLTVVQALYAQQTSQVYLVLCEVTHSEFTPVRVVNNTENITSNGDLYVPFPFSVILPPDQEDLQLSARLTIFDAEREVIDNLRFVAGSRELMEVTLRVIEAANPDTVLQSVSGLQVRNVSYQIGRLELDISVEGFLNEGYPRDSFTPGNFPGIF